MLPCRGISLAGHGLRCIRPIPPRLQGTRQLSQSSSHKNFLFSRTPSRPVRPSPSSLATIGRANISLWPWSKPQQGLGFSPNREGTPDPTPATSIKPEASTYTNDAVTSASTPGQPSIPPSSVESVLQPTPLPLESFDQSQSLIDAVKSSAIAEDHIGFMKEMGIQYGFPYFTNGMQFIIENVHVYGGNDWWATIALSALVVRAVMFVPFAMASHHQAKMAVISPYLNEAKDRMKQAQESKDLVLRQQVTEEMNGLKKAVGLKMAWVFAPMVVQGIAGYCAFKLIRAMSNLPVPGLETGGFLWIHDLTIPDPTFIIPIAMACSMHIIGRMGGESGAGNEAQKQMTETMRSVMLWMMPAIMGIVVVFQPAALQVSFATAMLWGIAQSYCFRQVWFRKLFKMELLPSQISRFERPSHALLQATTDKIKANGVETAKRIAGQKQGKLKTVSAPTIRYEAPHTQQNPQRLSAFQASPRNESQQAGTTPATPAPKEGWFSGVRKQAYAMQKETSAGIGSVMDSAKKQMGTPKAQTPREKRAAEYEKRRKGEKRDEAEMRRQGRS